MAAYVVIPLTKNKPKLTTIVFQINPSLARLITLIMQDE